MEEKKEVTTTTTTPEADQVVVEEKTAVETEETQSQEAEETKAADTSVKTAISKMKATPKPTYIFSEEIDGNFEKIQKNLDYFKENNLLMEIEEGGKYRKAFNNLVTQTTQMITDNMSVEMGKMFVMPRKKEDADNLVCALHSILGEYYSEMHKTVFSANKAATKKLYDEALQKYASAYANKQLLKLLGRATA